MNFEKRWSDYLLPVGIIGCLLVIFLPLPPAIMDVLLAANISFAVVILLGAIYARSPLELSVFPSILLATTLARLSLNIATTRLILTKGATHGETAAGGVIQSFAGFVTGESIAVGLVIFSIIVVVQFVVITKGATRISEVTARFALDGLPGRQMAIDAELNAGTIDAKRAQAMRREVTAHADFYGAMDGASKFVRGDAVAGVLITAINIGVGLMIGMANQMSLAEAASTFTMLTIGDGLVSQIPALLISLAAGLLVTRGAAETSLSSESVNQFFSKPVVMVMTAAFLCVMVTMKMPMLPLLTLAAGFLLVAFMTGDADEESEAAQAVGSAVTPPPEVGLDKLLSNDVLEIELGIDLIQLADTRQGGTLLADIGVVRKQLASEMGIVLPKIRIKDNLSLPQESYRVLLQGNEVESGSVNPDALLAIDSGLATGPLEGHTIVGMASESVMPQPAYWILPEYKPHAVAEGYQISKPTEMLTAQVKQLALEHAASLLTRDATRTLIDEVSKHSPSVVSELIPSGMSLAEVQHVLKMLVSEGISIRPLSLILETLGDHCSETKNRWQLNEKVRVRLGRHISAGLAGVGGRAIAAFTLSEELQDRIAYGWHREHSEIRLDLPRQVVDSLARAIVSFANQMAANGMRPIILVQQHIRPVIAEMAVESQTDLFVLGTGEVVNATIEIVGEVTADQLGEEVPVAA